MGKAPISQLLLGTLAPVVLLLGALAIAGPASAGTPVGAQFQLNSYTAGSQLRPSVAVDGDGYFVVVWESSGSAGSDSSSSSIQGQLYDSSGNLIGGEFQINTYTTSFQSSPSVSVDADGDFVVVWESSGSAGSDSLNRSIQGQRYEADGSAVGAQFQVNSYTTGNQQLPSVSVDADGDFVVVWEGAGSAGSDTSSGSVHGRRYDSGGNALGAEFQVNTYTTSQQVGPAVSVDADGDFVVVWRSTGSFDDDDSGSSVQGRRFDSNGNGLGAEFQVNTYTTGAQRSPSVSSSAFGDFVVVWHGAVSAGTDTSSYSVQGQRYDAGGNAQGAEFQVNTYTTLAQKFPSVAVDVDGDFVVVWSSGGSADTDDSSYSVQGQRYDASGNPVSSEFQVNSHTTSGQFSYSVAVDPDGDFVIVWSSGGSPGDDSSSYSAQGQRYTIPEPTGMMMLAAGIAFLSTIGSRRIKA